MLVDLLCYGIAQGTKAKIANRLNVYKTDEYLPEGDKRFLAEYGIGDLGEHIEAMRVTMVRIVKRLPDDQQQALVKLLAQNGIELDPSENEGGKP